MKKSTLDNWLVAKTGLRGPMSRQSIEQYQMDTLRQTILFASAHSSFYANLYANVDTASLKTYADLAKLPLISAEDIRRHGTEMVCLSQSEIKRIVSLTSSGSQGAPKRIYFSQEDLELTLDFFAHGMATLTEAGERVMICMPCAKPDGIGDLLARGLKRIGVDAIRYGAISDFADAVVIAEQTKPDCLVGIPVQMLRLASTFPGLRPRTVLLSADYISEAVKQRIALAWNCEVYAHYGLTESGLGGGLECASHNGYHLRHADLLFEIIDPVTGEQLPDGKTGEVVFTTLTREAMPLIRFRTGDISRLLEEYCACGSVLQRLDRIEGRHADTLFCGQDKILTIQLLDEILFARPDVLDYTPELSCNNGSWLLTVKLLSDSVAKPSEIEAYIRAQLSFNLQVKVEAGLGFETDGTKKRRLKLVVAEE